MKYVLSIDWLTIFCMYMGEEPDWTLREDPASLFSYHMETFGTRCFSRFCRVRMANKEGGIDEFAEIQATPYSSILPTYAVMVRFVNRALYLPDFWTLADRLLQENLLACQGISRVDICADFNDFTSISPRGLIEGFAAKKLRHIGRGVGALYFSHGVGAERDESGKIYKDYGVRYTGLSFGTHASDAHVYLYNKSEELRTQGDKPWIRDRWKAVGLNPLEVWRLEVSIKSSGLKFRDKSEKKDIQIGIDTIYDDDELDKIYHTFVRKLFSFVKNRKDISNITREPRIVLFDSKPCYDRGSIRNISSGNRMERIMIKYLHQLADRYRGAQIYQAREVSQHLANCLSFATDLHEWYEGKQNEWEKQIHK